MHGFLLLMAALLGGTASAHEYVAKPAAMQAQPGQAVGVEVVSSHVFIRSQELEDAKDSLAGFWVNGARTPMALRPDEAAMMHRGEARAPAEGCFLVTGHWAGQVWSATPQGAKRVGRDAPGATNTRMIEKSSKSLVNASPDDARCLRPIGDRLEIVALTNPAKAKPGQEVTVQVLFDGRTLTVPVFATYDGFSAEENTYAYYTEGRPDGTARVKITQPDLWMVRTEHATADRTATHDRYVGPAVLLFEVE